MRSNCCLLWIYVANLLCGYTVLAEPQGHFRRQDNTLTSFAASPTISLIPTSSESDFGSNSVTSTQSTLSDPTVHTSTRPTTLSLASATSINASTSSEETSSTTRLIGPLPTILNVTNANTISNVLPIRPRITPALAVAGVILILSGAVYTIIGIKNKRLQIFFSAAYLGGLSVTVLLVYLENPPVSNAVQGAYLIAAVLAAIVLGILSLFFPEVTEGLGCLFGGFCLSMWLLVLRPGGLLHSTSGKLVLIVAFTLTTYALSFSQHTRPYGLMGSTSFGGATVVVIGIDCFSQAGLKEFWLYIWNLNSKIFPLLISTYPIERGMRVEIACVIVITVVGIISQLKLWKVIKNRREEKEVIRRNEERGREEIEAEVGRRLEESNLREREGWEAVYDGRPKQHRGLMSVVGRGLSRRKSVDVETTEMLQTPPDVFEMNALRSLKTRKSEIVQGRTIDPGPVKDASTGYFNTIAEPSPLSGTSGASSSFRIPRKTLARDTSERRALSGTSEQSVQRDQHPVSSSALPPQQPSGTRLGRSISQTPGTDIAELDAESGGHAKRFDERSIRKKLSGRRSGGMLSSYRSHGSFLPLADSVATTTSPPVQEVLSPAEPNDDLERQKKRQTFTNDASAAQAGLTSKVQQPRHVSKVEAPSGYSPAYPDPMVPEEYDPFRPEYFTAMDLSRPLLGNQSTKVSSEANPSSNITPLHSEDLRADLGTTQSVSAAPTIDRGASRNEPSPMRQSSASEASRNGSLTEGALQRVLGQSSGVAMSDRTNEWAKHLQTADAPGLDVLQQDNQNEEPSVRMVETGIPSSMEARAHATHERESSVPAGGRQLEGSLSDYTGHPRLSVNAEELEHSPPDSARHTPLTMNGGQFPAQLPSQKGPKRAPSASIPRSWSGTQEQLRLSTRGFRNSSMPIMGQQLTASPASESGDPSYPYSAMGPTLMAQRHNKIHNKYSSLSLAHSSTSPTGGTLQDPYSSSPSRLSLDDDDNMSLSQRRTMIHQQRQSDEYARPDSRLSSNNHLYSAHQPPHRKAKIPRPEQREAMLADWRVSLQQDMALQTTPLEDVEAKRAQMMVEKHTSRLRKEQETSAKTFRDSSFDLAMRRRNDMQELHREAMRRMQASANKHV